MMCAYINAVFQLKLVYKILELKVQVGRLGNNGNPKFLDNSLNGPG
jgi:hypothetical protein